MSNAYTRNYATRGPTAQTKKLPGREKEQFIAPSGGALFIVSDWTQLERFLKFGTIGGTYYVREQQITADMANVVMNCLHEDGKRVVDMIIDISTKGLNIKQDQIMFALSLACSIKHGDDKKDRSDPKDPLRLTREYALHNAHKVIRTGSHLLMFMEMIKAQRGSGTGLKKMLARWYAELSPAEQVAFQVMKYQNRNSWTHRDVLRLAHIKDHTKLSEKSKVLDEYVRVQTADHVHEAIKNFKIIEGVQEIFTVDHKDDKKAAQLIVDFGLPRECVPTEFLNSKLVWEALLQKMPLTALARNLGKMTNIGLIKHLSDAELFVIKRLQDAENVKKSRIHPIKLLIALKTYQRGSGFKGKLTWSPTGKVVDALDEAFYLSFGFVEPMNKKIAVAIDDSGSMNSPCAGEQVLTCREAAVAMAMLYVRTEQRVIPMHFSDGARLLDLSPKMRLDDALKHVPRTGNGTDASAPVELLMKNKLAVDVIIEMTDNQSWSGKDHVSNVFKRYQEKFGAEVKFVSDMAGTDRGTICDPKNSNMMDVCGFDGSVPLAVQNFVLGLSDARPVEQEEDNAA